IGNLWALLPLAAAVIVLWLPYQLYAALGAPLALFGDPAWSSLANWLFGALVVAGSIVLHEGLHGLALVALGYRARLRFASGYFFATTDGFLTRRDYLIMVLTPLLAMTLGGGLVLLFLPVSLGQTTLIALLLNAAASVGDLAVADRARRQPAAALFADRGSIKVFLPEGFDHAEKL
ncbi:MAG: metalloprotease family protein, partial [Anaerolineae bacterium]